MDAIEEKLDTPPTQVSSTVYPQTTIRNYREAEDIFASVELQLTADGKIPVLEPYEPPSYDNETNNASDPAFRSLSHRDRNEREAAFDGSGNVIGIGYYSRGRLTRDSIAASTRVLNPETGEYETEGFEPTEEHLPLRQVHTIRIANPLPDFSGDAVSGCSDPIEGNGSRANPYKIHTFAQLDQHLRAEPSSYFELACDIDASPSRTQNGGQGFRPIRYFAGFLDGKGHTIQGLYINRPNERQVGLFGHLLGSRVSNLTIENATVIGKYEVGILAGHAVRSLVDSVKATGRVQGAGETGGLIGFQSSHFFAVTRPIRYRRPATATTPQIDYYIPYRTAEVVNSHTNILVNCVRGTEAKESHRMCGGLVGWLGTGFVTRSSSRGNVIMSEAPVGDGSSVDIDGDMAGGLIGVIGTNESTSGINEGADVFQKAKVYQSYSQANIYGGITIGGLVGLSIRGGSVIAESYADSRVEGHGILAGLIAMVEASYIVNCYALGDIYSHYDELTSDRYVRVPAGAIVYTMFGFSNSMATGEDHFSTWQRRLARYLTASRFKIGIENSYAHVRIHLVSSENLGTLIEYATNMLGGYYRLDGSVHSVVENVFDNVVVREFARNSQGIAGALRENVILSTLPSMKDIWSVFEIEYNRDSDTTSTYHWSNTPHLRVRNHAEDIKCVTAPGATCRGKTTFTGWSDDIWLFDGVNYPGLENVVPDPAF